MRLASFERKGRPGFGVVVGDGVVDLAARFAGKANSLREALERAEDRTVQHDRRVLVAVLADVRGA